MSITIGRNFHIVHMTGDLKALDAWYYDIFSVQRFMPDSYMPAEKRDASLVVVGDLCVEPLAPAFHVEGWDIMPLGRFYRRFGDRLHSLAWYVDEGMDELYDQLRAADVRLFGTGGVKQEGDKPQGALFTHPRDTFTQLEFIPTPPTSGFLRDPRLNPSWAPSWWADAHPLHLEGVASVTVAVHDAERARDVYVSLLDGQLLHEREHAGSGTRSAYVLVGDLVVEFAEPVDESAPIALDMAQHHESLYGITFKVRDLDLAAHYLARKGVQLSANDGTTITTDPASTHGAVFAFTTQGVPNDPRDDWSAAPAVAAP